MMRLLGSFLAATVLVACTDGQPLPVPQSVSVPAEVTRAYADLFQDKPFDEAAVKVVATEGKELRTYTLRPCQNGSRICGSRTGTLQVTPDYYVVSGAYPGRVFYLSPGGDGVLRAGGTNSVLAWNETAR